MRIRTVKPEFFNHEGIFDAEHETNLPLRLAFIGLWCAADREGRFKWESRRLKTQIMPYDLCDFSRVLDALMTRGFIVKYATETGEYGCIPSFSRHQVVNNRERDSELPEPNDANICDACLTREPRDDHASKAEGKGREGNMERKGKDSSCPISSDESEALDLIWKSATSKGKERSSKVKLAKEWKKIPKDQKPTLEQLSVSLTAWGKSQKWQEGYSEGIHIWVQDQQWQNEPLPYDRQKQKQVSFGMKTTIADRHPNEMKSSSMLEQLRKKSTSYQNETTND